MLAIWSAPTVLSRPGGALRIRIELTRNPHYVPFLGPVTEVLRFHVGVFHQEHRREVDTALQLLDNFGLFSSAMRRDHFKVPEVMAGLGILQSLQPGVGTSDLRSCLLAELDSDGSDVLLARKMIENLPPDASRGGPIDASGHTVDEIIGAVNQLENIDFWPDITFTSGLADAHISSRVPRECMFCDDCKLPFGIRLFTSALPAFDVYLPTNALDEKARINQLCESSKKVTTEVEQHRESVLKMLHDIGDFQRTALLQGVGYLRPLSLKELADSCGIRLRHLSAMANKFLVATDQLGTVSILSFISKKSSDVRIGVIAAQERIASIINSSESGDMSDQEISAALEREGLSISRRAVGKYRATLGWTRKRQQQELRDRIAAMVPTCGTKTISDQEIAAALECEGLTISRRTVARQRVQLGLSARQQKISSPEAEAVKRLLETEDKRQQLTDLAISRLLLSKGIELTASEVGTIRRKLGFRSVGSRCE